MSGHRIQWLVVVGAVMTIGLTGSSRCYAQANAQSPTATLIAECKKQQMKVEEVAKKLLKAGEEYAAAKQANKPDADTLMKKYQELQTAYDKEVAALREITKKLDMAASMGDLDAATERDAAIRSLGKMLGELIAQVLGAFLGGMQPEERSKYLEASSKAVLGLPLNKEEIDALAKVPKPGQGSPLFDFYKEYSNTPNWPALRDSMIATAMEQLGKTTPAALAMDAVKTALKEGKTASQVVEAVIKPLANGKFNTKETRSKFLEAVRMIAPADVVDELAKIEVDE